MRGQVSTWLGLENGAGQGTLLDPHPSSLSCCPGSRKELQSFLDSPQPLNPGAAARCHPRTWSRQQEGCPLRAGLGNATQASERGWQMLPTATGPGTDSLTGARVHAPMESSTSLRPTSMRTREERLAHVPLRRAFYLPWLSRPTAMKH